MVFLTGKINGEFYSTILRENVLASAKANNLEKFIFKHDGAPIHNCKVVKNFLEKNSIEVMKWAAQSPDLNPIEYLLGYINKKLKTNEFPLVRNLKKNCGQKYL